MGNRKIAIERQILAVSLKRKAKKQGDISLFNYSG